ncbi:glycogen synthase GlgA [Thioclava sp. SK-1]|uniref:glycogen synthase GlgA n=1 Tax=Thioclava sp. SK-1 TaxID=1889770 RepID=UPI0009F39443|nr:glycogen synthase GlgA [Thioclava sp. SK-1]
MKRVLSVASEAVPLIKTGGLADVVGALPAALAPMGWDMRVILPAYPGVIANLNKGSKAVWASGDLFGGPATLILGQCGEMQVMALDAPHLYARTGGPYSDGQGDYADNAERFAALSWVAAEIARHGTQEATPWHPDIVHAHDWQAALTPAYLSYAGAQAIPSVLTIHNIAFQGRFSPTKMAAMRLPAQRFTPDGFEFWGDISTLKAGLVSAHAITTVSPRYADELMRPEFGLGLEGVLQYRADVMSGILNGIDKQVWDPENDPEVKPFSAAKLAGKKGNRAALIAEFSLDANAITGPLMILVSRLTSQKGIDMVPGAISEFLANGGGLIVLGSGDRWAEAMVQDLSARYPGRVGNWIGYDEGLSHRMFAGGDAVLIPSRFEPCGLTQLYGMRYGCVPIVAAVGGLADTVIDATPAACAAHAATGIVFQPVDTLGLRQALRRLTALWNDPKEWAATVKRGMKTDWGWEPSAHRYVALYEATIRRGTDA